LADDGGQCLTGSATEDTVPGCDGLCNYQLIPNYNEGFNLGFGVSATIFASASRCGECYQLMGAWGATSTYDNNPAPTAIMIIGECQSETGWCSNQNPFSAHFDMCPDAWTSFADPANDNLNPFLYTYQKIACPLNGKNVGVYIAQASDFTLAFTPYWHIIGVSDSMEVKEHGQTKWSRTGARTNYNQYQYTAKGANGLSYPIDVRITANTTGERIVVTINSPTQEGDIYDSGQQFSITNDIQSPGKDCYHPFDPVVYGDNVHTPPIADGSIDPADFWFAISELNYVMQSTAVTPYGGLKFCLEIPYANYGSFQFQRLIPVFKTEVRSLQMYLKGSAATKSMYVTLHGETGSSNTYYPKITTDWTLYTLYLNTTDIPAQITAIYFQYNVAGDITIYYNDIEFVTKVKREAGGPYPRDIMDQEIGRSDAVTLNNFMRDLY